MAADAIDTQGRDPIRLGLALSMMTVDGMAGRRRGKREEIE